MIAALSVTPLGVGPSVGDHVADCVRIVRDSGLPNETNALFTNIEGDWEDIQAVVGRCLEHLHARGVPRVSVVLKVVSEPGAGGGLTANVRAVEERLAVG